jgi:hypothetical protein
LSALPEPRSREAHEHVNRLRAELHRIRAEHGRGTSQGLEAFIRYMHDAAVLGLSPTALAEYSDIEEDRFFARVIDGPDRHRYWAGRDQRFKCNDGRTRHPRRWWFEHENNIQLGFYEDITPSCGDKRCIAPWHGIRGRGVTRRLYSDAHMLGGLQVEALRLGRGPSAAEWDAAGRKPGSSNFTLRFGSWTKAIRAAGLTPHGRGRRK